MLSVLSILLFFFFFNDTATTEIYTLSLHDALPICARLTAVHRTDDGELVAVSARCTHLGCIVGWNKADRTWECPCQDRKSTRLNSSHANISYAVFCLKKKKKTYNDNHIKILIMSTQ